jgi:hypothetical protein
MRSLQTASHGPAGDEIGRRTSRERTPSSERNYVFERAELSLDVNCIGYRLLFNFRKTANIREKFVGKFPVIPDASEDPTPRPSRA